MTLHQGGLTIDAVYVASGNTGFTPTETVFSTPGAFSYTVPAGATKIDVVAIGGGGGGNCGGAGGDEGLGGGAGSWVQRTLTVGVDVTAGATIAGTVGGGGAAGTPGLTGSPGGAGTATTIPVLSLSARGGDAPVAGGGGDGKSPGDVTLNGRTYKGGAVQLQSSTNTNGLPGNPPGGGACGGRGVVIGSNAAAPGGAGKVWFFAYTSDMTLCHSVWLGNQKVWPIYVANQSQWYSPAAGQSITVPWPVNAEFCDVIMVGGGAGGTGTGVGGNAQKGGGDGQWSGLTLTKIAPLSSKPRTSLTISVIAAAGTDGAGGGNFSTQAADGSIVQIATYNGATVLTRDDSTRGLDMTSNTNNRNGGNVAPTFTFNGRTYTMASYGAGAGQGGNSTNNNGSNGNRPGGGGQSAANGGLTGNNGGTGAHGAAILYWY